MRARFTLQTTIHNTWREIFVRFVRPSGIKAQTELILSFTHMTDHQLLEQFVFDSDQQAFAELVERHVHWVNGMAERIVGDPALAADVTQAVFILLAQKAPRMSRGIMISGWLFTVTRFAALKALRQRNRRQHHESRAAAMKERSTIGAQPTTSASWEHLSPLLDELVVALRTDDRQAILMRFYQQLTFPEIGSRLSVSEEAARKRVSRAVERLRILFSRKGITIGATALAATLCAGLPHAASAAVVSCATSGGAVASTQTTFLVQGAITMMTINQMKLAAAGCIAALLLIGGAVAIVSSMRPSAPAAAATQRTADWNETFHSVYAMRGDEALRNIAPPYIPERLTYYTSNQPRLAATNPSEPPVYVFEWDQGRLMRWGTLSGENSRPVSLLIPIILRMKSYDCEGPAELMDFRVAGDWIRRIDSTPAERLEALSRIVAERGGPSVTFVQQNLARPVLIARGTYAYHAPEGLVEAEPRIHIYSDDADLLQSGKPRGSNTVNQIIEELGAALNLPVSSTIAGGASEIEDVYHNFANLSQTPAGSPRDRIVSDLLRRVEQQTGLKLSIELQNRPVWVAQEAVSASRASTLGS